MKKADLSVKCFDIKNQKYRKYVVKYKGQYILPDNSLDGVRTKYIVGKHILKVETDKNELYSHIKREVKIFKSLDDADRPYFVPLVYWNYKKKYVVQRFIELEESPEIVKKKDKKLIEKLIDKYNLVDVAVDSYGHNWNWAYNKLTGRPIIFDYGL